MIKSKFRSWIILPLFLFLGLFGLSFLLISLLLADLDGFPFAGYIFIFLFLFISALLFWGELKNKCNGVLINDDRIFVRKYLGLGKQISFSFPEIDGFQTANLTSRYHGYEYLYLLKDGRKLIKISEFYHSNYWELKEFILLRSKNLGVQKVDFIREIQESFR